MCKRLFIDKVEETLKLYPPDQTFQDGTLVWSTCTMPKPLYHFENEELF